uniref:CHK domain-containing protein n=1 Tax=Caenorhabditis tropicalis TaxID=1561998 RepID=A0A1I7U2K8_9PELO
MYKGINMGKELAQLFRLVENSFPDIQNFFDKHNVDFERLNNAKSFWSEIYVARLSGEGVPESIFIKIPRIGGNVLRCEDEEGIDELENVLTYYSKKENLFYKHFPYGSIPNFPFPKVYFTEDVEEYGTGGIVAENLTDKVYAVEHIPGLNHEQVLRLMEALAGFHSHLLMREDKSYVESFVEGAHGRETYAPGMQNMMVGLNLNF